MKRQIVTLSWLIILALALAGCGRNTPPPGEPPDITGTPQVATPVEAPKLTDAPGPTATPTPSAKKITLWHGWSGAEADALVQIAESFATGTSGVIVDTQAFPLDQLKDKFIAEAKVGGGPDLLIGPSEWGLELSQANLIQPLDELGSQIGLNNLNSTAVEAGRRAGKVWAFPITIESVVLWYNTDRVKQAPQTTDELLKLAEQAGLGLGTSFSLAAGLIMGQSKLLDAQGQCALAQGGAGDALAFIKKAASAKGVIADTDAEELAAAFRNGKVAMVFSGTDAAGAFKQAIGADKLAVAEPILLRYGTGDGTYAPLLDAQDAFLSANSSGGIVLDFLSFVSQADAQRALAAAGLIPSNPNVKTDDPLMAALVRQMQSLSALPSDSNVNELLAAGDEMIAKVIAGKAEPAGAVSEACAAIDTAIRK